MKKLVNMSTILIVALITLCGNVYSQSTTESYTIPLSNPGEDGKLITHIIDGNITVTGYDGNEVIVTAIGATKDNKWNNWKTERKGNNNRDGMRKIVDNSLEFTVEEIDNTVKIKYRPGKWVIDFEVQVPRKFSVDLKTVNKGNILVENVDGTHEVSNTNGKITMNDIGGSVIADALNKDITVTFTTIHQDTNMMFTSLNGDIDIKFPNSLKANVMARSDNGDVYSDFEMETSKSQKNVKTSTRNGVYRVSRGKGVSGSINGGGADMTFKTLNGDIMIRSN